jgi:hypothetical protein
VFRLRANLSLMSLFADELYVVVPGAKLEAVSDALGIITSANAALEEYARGRQGTLSTA